MLRDDFKREVLSQRKRTRSDSPAQEMISLNSMERQIGNEFIFFVFTARQIFC